MKNIFLLKWDLYALNVRINDKIKFPRRNFLSRDWRLWEQEFVFLDFF